MKSLLGLAPQLEPDGSYRPSKLALRMATSATTDFTNKRYEPYTGKRSKVLVIATEQKNMVMANGKEFSTGNHPVEMLVPMLHLRNAGFDFDVATPTGQPVQIEMWAFPNEDEHVNRLYQELAPKFAEPLSLAKFVAGSLDEAPNYAAVYIPGGHGAMLGLPDDGNVGTVLRWAHDNDLFTISICHGPAALLATTADDEDFLYDGYKMAVFPHSVDKQTPRIGYMPGHMPWPLSDTLEELGATVVNKKADDSVYIDRRLISGAGPQAANALGELAATTLLEQLQPNA